MKLNFLIPKLHGNDYSNLITAFAVIIAVEYTTGSYDAWDIFVGILSIGLGFSFIKDAKDEHKKHDFWFGFITASLISLGIVSIISTFIFILSGFSEPKEPTLVFLFELLRFGIFLSVAIFIWKKYVR